MSLIDTISNTIAPTTIENLKGVISKKGGLAPGNKFAVFLHPPVADTIGGTEDIFNSDFQGLLTQSLSGNFNVKNVLVDSRDIGILCEGCTFPAKAFNTIEYTKGGTGSRRKYITDLTTTDVTFTFHLTQDYYIRKIFEKWTNKCLNPKNKIATFPKTYKTDVVIQQLNNQNLPIYAVRLRGAFPISFDRTILSDNNAAPQKFSVTMTYDDYVTENSIESAVAQSKDFVNKNLNRIKKIVTEAQRVFDFFTTD